MTSPAEPRERQDWRERKRLNAIRREAQVDAVAITTRIESPPLPADDDEAGWRDLIRSLPSYDPYALGAGYDFEPEAAREPIEWIEQHVSHLEGEKAGQNFVLEKWQRAVIANLFGWLRPDGRRRFRECLIYLPKKSGKALALDTPIPTPSGWSRMGELVAGDAVFDEHGRQCRVVAVGPTQNDRPCYRVTFDDGTSIVADAEHEWYTDAYRTGRLPRGSRKGIPREETKQKPADHIRTTREILDTLRFSCGGPAPSAANHSIPIAEPLRVRSAPLPVEPYTLGAWLGDGSSNGAQFTCAMVDYQIIEEINRDGYESGSPRFYKPRSPGTATITLTPGVCGKRGTSRLRNAFRALGVLDNKHIPAAYLRASEAQRMALLQGLMDTDGCVSKAGDCNFDNTNESLIRGTEELLRSLGFKPRTKERRASVNGKDCGPSWRIQFKAFSDRPCFRLVRKVARLRPPPTYRARSMRRQIVSVDQVSSVPVRCIQVDSPSRLYLAGLGMVPTHNSALVRALVLYLFVRDDEPGSKVYCAAAKREQARIIWDACKLELARIDPPESVASRFQHSIVKPDGGFLKPISADAGLEDGMNPHGFVLDELHRQPDADLVNMARLSSRTRAQPLLIYLTTADEDRESVCNDMWKRALAVRSNPGDPSRAGFESRFLPVVFQAEPEDDWTSPATWRKAAPCLGVTIQEEEYAEECRLAKESPALEADFKRYFLNLRTRTVEKALDLAKWDACGAPFDPATLTGQECIAGIDLASTNDITALVLYFVKTGHILPWFWVPREAARKRDKVNDSLYLQWGLCRPPLLTLTEGDQLDEERVLSDMLLAVAPYKVLEVAVDPANSQRYTQPLMRRGFKVVQVRQGWGTLSSPLKGLSLLIGAGKIHHGGHPVLRWMVGNAEVEKDIKDNWTLVKSRGPEKIDGVTALVTAMARVEIQPQAPASVYEVGGRGLITF